MTDKELLELAAKAAGLKPFTAWGKTFVMGDGSAPKPEWNPLTDDGDALRLAVKLNLFDENTDFIYELAVQINSCTDTITATRRAIVLVAAEIGKTVGASIPVAIEKSL